MDSIAELNHCFKAFDKIALRHGMEPLRTMGDAYVAVSGGPSPNHTGHARKAVDAATEMQRFAVDRKTSQDALEKIGLQFRIAVHTGPAICGIMESQKFSFDIWGDTMGEILEMEKRGRPGDIILSDSTYTRLGEKISAVPLGEVETRSETPMGIFALQTVDGKTGGS